MVKGIIVGGNFGDEPKPSGLVNKIANLLGREVELTVRNGGSLEDLARPVSGYDLIIWMPNVSNDVDKVYPKKDPGAVLICSKVLRDGTGVGEAIIRIFKMHANAAISIDAADLFFNLNLVDALGNCWSDSPDIQKLVDSVMELYRWTKGSIRWGSYNVKFPEDEMCELKLDRLCAIVREVADKVENERGGRYFGNVSTRCSKMFPSARIPDNIVLISARNTNKDRLTAEDFVFTKLSPATNVVLYHGDKQPSVDAPIQLSMYKRFKNINFLIHGHAFIKNATFTSEYFPCGDMREFEEMKNALPDDIRFFGMNLLNHGFVIGAEDIDSLEEIARTSEFEYRVMNTPVVDKSLLNQNQ